MSGLNKCLQTAGKILLGAILVTGFAACGESENSDIGGQEPTISLEIRSTAAEEPTPKIRLSPTVESTATPEIITAVEITVGAANMRSEPDSDSEIVGIVGAEENLELIEISEDGQWYRVESESGVIGWVGSSVASITDTESPQGDQSDDEDVELDVTPTAIPPAAPQEPAPPAPVEPAPAESAPPQPAPTEPPAPSGPPAGVPGFCTCSGPDLNCPAFGTHAQAQACHDHCMGLGHGDIYGLDGHNNNGLACESLP